jgi:gliding motility-associated-like protein
MVTAVDSSWGGAMPYSYSWNSNPVQTNATANLSSGNYILTVVDSDGCKTTVPLVAPTTDPVASFKAIPDTVSAGDSVALVSTSTGSIVWYWWTFGDGGNSADSITSHIYNYGGNYVVTLYVGNSLGCRDSVEESFYVTEGIMNPPNVFTPNGDGINDVFHINAYGLANYKIEIFDRWGLLMFEGTGDNNDWTGRDMAGEPVSAGVYYYIITASDLKGKSFNTKGFVEVIR